MTLSDFQITSRRIVLGATGSLLTIALVIGGCQGGKPAASATPPPLEDGDAAHAATPPIDDVDPEMYAMALEMIDGLDVMPGDIGPLSVVPIPDDNPQTDAKIKLGHQLYFDARLSADRSISCATCHAPDKGWSDALPTAVGFNDQVLGRHSPTVINTAYNDVQFWDGRSATLEDQAKGPIMAEGEMNLGGEAVLIERLRNVPMYVQSFQEVFGESPNIDNVAKAIAAFERTVVTGDSRFDLYMKGDKQALSDDEKYGLFLYIGKARCTECHNGANFTDNKYHNLGVGQLAEKPDPGRFSVSGDETDFGAFKTPTLRNIAQTAPYMHDGSLSTLYDVVSYYNNGGTENPHRSELIDELDLTEREKWQLVAFMEALTGPLPLVAAPTLPPDAAAYTSAEDSDN